MYALFFHPGEVVELRGLGLSGKANAWEGRAMGAGVVYGYFDDPVRFAAAAEALDQAGARGVYFTANPVQQALLARAVNRLRAADAKPTLTTDTGIACHRWLLVDIDPVRPAGISSSAEELEQAAAVGEALTGWLETECGWPAGIRALSGNGYHVMYRLPDLPLGDEIGGSSGLLCKALQALQARFGRSGIKIDTVNHNPSRIWKMYGTMARKGDSTGDRPHRRSSLASSAPELLEQVQEVSLKKLQTLADLVPAPPLPVPRQKNQAAVTATPASKKRNDKHDKAALGPLKVDEYLEYHNIPVTGTKPGPGGGTMYLFDTCVFNQDHNGPKACRLTSSPTPPFLTYHCFHESCRGRTWKEAREIISGNASLAKFCEGYDPDWAPPATKQHEGPAHEPNEDEKAAMIPVVDGAEWEERPEDTGWYRFFNTEKSRPVFLQEKLAKYLVQYLAPIIHTSGDFWRYTSGRWREISRAEIGKVAAVALGAQMQASRVEAAINSIVYFSNMEEPLWTKAGARIGNLVNVANGMLDLEKFKLLPHRADYYCRTQVATKFDPFAECPLWIKSIGEIFSGNTAKMLALQEFMGYLLMPTCRYEKCAFFFGTGSNGKSTVLDICTWLLGEENVSALSLSALSRQFPLAALRAKMLNSATEVDPKDRAGTETLKQIISGDLLSSDTKFGKEVTFRTFCKCIFAMNTPPPITDRAYGFVRKVLVINFDRRFSEDEHDKYLRDKLREQEMPGILNWSIEGARRLISQGKFSSDQGMRSDTTEFMAKMNPILNFVMDHCLLHEEVLQDSTEIFDDYKKWCETRGYKWVGQGRFNDQLEGITGIRKERPRIGGARKTVFRGIGLRKDWSAVISEAEERELKL